VSLSLARDRHTEARKMLASGVDPMAQRKADKTAQSSSSTNSFRAVAAHWYEHWKGGKSSRHADSVKRRMAADILPCLGARPIVEIEAPELVLMAKAIEQRGARDIAKRALETTGQVFRYAIAHGYARRNPASEIRASDILKSSRKTNHPRIDARELPDLLKRIEVYQGTHVTRLAMKFMALSFVRTSELIGAKWSELDMDAARWNIPAERMKMRTPHIVPLSKQALEVLDLLRNLTGNGEWLFPGDRNPARPMSKHYDLERTGAHGLQGDHDRPGISGSCVHDLA
jgi:integrase